MADRQTDRDRLRIFVGFSPEEMVASCVAEASIRNQARGGLPDIRRISRMSLHGAYDRPTELRDGQRWDVISDAPMSTDHAIARFFVPWVCEYDGWALFTDGDILCRTDISDLFAQADDRFAILCVPHPDLPTTGTKKAGALQVPYRRKNWSSVMLFNCGHPKNAVLCPEVLNLALGRHLHAFAWLDDADIGALDPSWNYLVGVHPPMANPRIVHFTEGTPIVPGHAHDPFAEEWFRVARGCGYAWERG